MTMGYLIITTICWTWLMITIGYKLGKRYGWQLRDNIEKTKDVLNNIKKADELKDYNAMLYKNIKGVDFNIIGLKRKIEKDEPLNLRERLKIAVINEDYELAAKIHNEINKNKK